MQIHHPEPDEIFLIIEVADTTLSRDLGPKAKLYGAVSIPDYWVFDVQAQTLHVFRAPTAEGYQEHRILSTQDAISPLAFPSNHISVKACFGLPL